MSTFKQLIESSNATIKKIHEDVADAFLDELKNVFIFYPELQVMKWNQYTPYFNDGESCEFTIGEIFVSNNPGITHQGEWYEDDDSDDENTEPSDLLVESLPDSNFNKLNTLIAFMNSSLGEQILEDMYGTNVNVTVSRAGVETEDCDSPY